jgi:hypothetical protein
MRENVKHDWLVDDIFLLTANFVSQEVDSFLYFLEVSKFLVGNLFELSPRFNKL